GRELDSVAVAGAAAVVVKRPAKDVVERTRSARRQRSEEARRPLAIAAVGAGGDELQGGAVLRQPRGVPTEFGGVLLGREIAAAAPRLVADAPVPHAERLAIAARRAQVGHRRRAGRRVAVLDPLIEIAGGQTADVRGDVRRGAGQPAKADELV